MKKLNSTRIKYQFIVIVLFLTQFVQAQPGFNDGDDVEDVPAAPIDDWLIPLIVLGLIFMFFYLKNKNKYKMLNK